MMEERTKDAITISILVVALAGVLWAIWTSEYVIDSLTMSKLLVSTLIIVAILFAFVFTTHTTKRDQK